MYDIYVLAFSNAFVWQCPSRLILDFYNKYMSGRHLDMGVGTGYFLDKCKLPTYNPTIALADINLNSLRSAAKRLQRYNIILVVDDRESVNLFVILGIRKPDTRAG